ncbi:hypothetical protein AAP_02637 [Ascosphaera apis ARSEF 7405]|uniref:Uncharacterized protein n=1 Tax=Ascosphaera apis ARSEF 7405 TaxID=392613 RepID=A0A167ZW61_9EURO|nr:hypothetical protein AAP_02637 [Ascosphaera apis ARSEF 7405]
MAPAISDPSAVQLAQSLSPYVRSRQEALEIRRTIATFLSSQVVPPTACGNSHLSACTPYGVSEVKSVPAQVEDQIYAEYLAALQANVHANREYHRLIESYRKDREEYEALNNVKGVTSGLQTYAYLLQSRREKEKFEIYREYLGQLTQLEGSQYGYLSLSDEQAQVSQLSQNLASHIGQHDGALGDKKEDVDSLIHRLERAVIQAKAEAQFEAEKLFRIEGRGSTSQVLHSDLSCQQSKVRALLRTRDELVQWVEDALTMSTTEDEKFHADNILKDDLDTSHLRQDGKAFVMEQYDAYLESRKMLLSTITEFLRPVPSKQLQSQRRSRPPLHPQDSFNSSPHDAPTIFSYIAQNVAPLTQAQNVSETQTPASVIAERAAVWAAAAGEARVSTKVAVSGQIEAGEGHLENADAVLEEVYRIMNQNVVEPGVEAEDKSTTLSQTNDCTAVKATGPWSQLKGDISL